MPLLCSSVLALLLLPLSLSCNSQSFTQVNSMIVRVDLDNARDAVTSSLHNFTCQELKHKIRSCASHNNTDPVDTLRRLACKMKDLELPHTARLTSNILNSMRCSCTEKPTTAPVTRLQKRMAEAKRRRRTEQRRSHRERRKLCRTKAFLDAVTHCYEMLNDQLSTGT